ncbi:MAG: membrane protein insertase YidC [Chromatiales bacterium]|nr:membrane protein insertase YidC [Chromatiales bacterium]
MENSRLILYLSLALVLFLLWERWQVWQSENYAISTPPTQPYQQATSPETDTYTRQDDLPEAVAYDPTKANTVIQNAEQNVLSRRVQVTTDVLELDISTRGGDIIRADLLKQPLSINEPNIPFRLLNNGEGGDFYIVQSGLLHDQIAGISKDTLRSRAPSHHEEYQIRQPQAMLGDNDDTLRTVLYWDSGDGIEVDKIYTFKRASYLLSIEHLVRNNSDDVWVGRQYRQLRRGHIDEDDFRLLYTFTGAAYYNDKYNKLPFDEIAEQQLNTRIVGGWVAMLQHYFLSALLPSAEQSNDFYTRVAQGGVRPEYIIGMRSEPIVVEPKQQGRFITQLYVGPKLQNQLEEIQEGLELTTDYGIFSILSKPLFWLLDLIHDLIGNWGWAIVLLTLLIKLIFYKLSEISYKSMARMRKLQPSLMALRERFINDKERMQKEMMEFYKKEKINPMGGCLPILVQIPVFIALYWVLLESVELRQAPFMFWLNDLSTRDPYYVLPLLMGATMLVQTKLNPTPPDPIQAKVMMVLPIVFTVFFAFFPSGLVLYWLVNNILSIAQQYVINKRIEQS